MAWVGRCTKNWSVSTYYDALNLICLHIDFDVKALLDHNGPHPDPVLLCRMKWAELVSGMYCKASKCVLERNEALRRCPP